MTGGLGIQLRKEVRALLPALVVVAIALTAIAFLARLKSGFPHYRNDLELWVAIVHGLGVLSLAALAFGHELMHGTMASLLVQPVARRRILLLKMVVLIPAAVLLGVLADSAFVNYYLWRARIQSQLLVWGPVAVAIGLVPVLTLLTRKPLGGVVFAIVIPGVIFGVSDHFYPLRDGAEAWWITWYGTLAAAGIGLLVLWRAFQNLEAVGDGSARASSRAAVAAARSEAAPRHWIWLLVKKELRLQYLTISVSGLYVVACVLVMAAQSRDPEYLGPTFYAVSALHCAFVALLAGAFASAEERQLGTLASQVLMPQATWRQWAVKVTVTLGLAVALAVGLPWLLMSVHRPADPFPIKDELVAAILLATSAAMYVSSLSSNSLWALLASFPAIGLTLMLTNGMLTPVKRAVWQWLPVDNQRISAIFRAEYRTDAWPARRAELERIYWLQSDAIAWVVAGVALMMMYFAARNHRSLERSVRTIATQATALLLMFWTATIACLAVAQIAYNAIR